MIRKAVFVFLVLVAISFEAPASGYLTGLGAGVGISKYQVLGAGGMVVWLSEDIPSNPDQCSVTSRVVISPTLAEYDLMVSAVMASYAQGKKVGFWSSGCTTTYFWGSGHTFASVRDMWVTD